MMIGEARTLTTKRVKSWLLAAALGGALALFCVAAGNIWLAPARLPKIAREHLLAAIEKWGHEEPARYGITVKVSGRQPGLYEVLVDNGVVSSARLNGRELINQRTSGTWSVPGMFNTIELDLETQSRSDRSPLILRGKFDEQYGFPRQYERMEMRTGAHQALSWEVTKFEVR
jgi:hypothetical protein